PGGIHHGAARPDVKNSAVLDPAPRQKNSAGMNEMTMEAAATSQSAVARCIPYPHMVASNGAKIQTPRLEGYIWRGPIAECRRPMAPRSFGFRLSAFGHRHRMLSISNQSGVTTIR